MIKGENMKLTCIMCPVGCELTVEKINEEIKVSGNGCIRGQRYGISEMTNPTRMITSLIKTSSGVVAVKTTNLVPKDKIYDVLNELKAFKIKHAKVGDIVIHNVAGLKDIDIIVTRNVIDEI